MRKLNENHFLINFFSLSIFSPSLPPSNRRWRKKWESMKWNIFSHVSSFMYGTEELFAFFLLAPLYVLSMAFQYFKTFFISQKYGLYQKRNWWKMTEKHRAGSGRRKCSRGNFIKYLFSPPFITKKNDISFSVLVPFPSVAAQREKFFSPLCFVCERTAVCCGSEDISRMSFSLRAFFFLP